jgi:prepilin-type N-terminal cleavage/methylation domain-containing protein
MSRRSARGFTLLEVMLALAILAFITMLLWGTFRQISTVKARAEAIQDRTHAARVALMRMSREIEMAFLSDSENPSLQERRTMFVGLAHPDVDELHFSWFGRQRLRADAPETDTSVVMYYAERDPDDRTVTNLMRRETRRLEVRDPHEIPGEAYVLCPGVARVKFAYFDYKKKEWKEEWNTLGADGLQYLPTHIRITLVIYDERGQEQVFTSSARIMMTERVAYRPVPQR